MMISQMNQSQLLHWIDMVSFAVVEITEYLDTHPDDEEALKYFNHYADLDALHCVHMRKIILPYHRHRKS